MVLATRGMDADFLSSLRGPGALKAGAAADGAVAKPEEQEEANPPTGVPGDEEFRSAANQLDDDVEAGEVEVPADAGDDAAEEVSRLFEVRGPRARRLVKSFDSGV